mgnify:CR=1 FL=1
MSEFVINTGVGTFKDQDGNILCEGSLLDIHYTVATKVNELKDKPQQEIYVEIAKLFQENFQPEAKKTKLSWATAMKISIEAQRKIDEEKKS